MLGDEIVATALWGWLAPRLQRIALPVIVSHVAAAVAYLLGVGSTHPSPDSGLPIGRPTYTAGSWSGLYGWDADSYATLAAQGYPTTPGDHLDAFLPLYPLFMRVPMTVGLSPAVSGILISLIAQCVALIAIDMLVTHERDARTGLFAIWLMALAPMGIFLDVVYTESTFIAAAAVSLYLARQGRLAAASVAAMVAGATRITGIVLGPVLLLEWLVRQYRRRRAEGSLPPLRDLAVVPLFALPVVPFVLFSLYLGAHTGDLNSYHEAQTGSSFNHDLALPWHGFLADWNQLTPDNTFYDTWWREVVYGLCGVGLCVAGWLDFRFPRSLALYCTLVFVLSTSITFWLSVPRYLLGIFPIVIVLADLTGRIRWARPLIVLACSGLFLWSAYTYGTGAWVA